VDSECETGGTSEEVSEQINLCNLNFNFVWIFICYWKEDLCLNIDNAYCIISTIFLKTY
jgi:hypothetical protein